MDLFKVMAYFPTILDHHEIHHQSWNFLHRSNNKNLSNLNIHLQKTKNIKQTHDVQAIQFVTF